MVNGQSTCTKQKMLWTQCVKRFISMLMVFQSLNNVYGVSETVLNILEQHCPMYKRCNARNPSTTPTSVPDDSNDDDITQMTSCCLPCSCDVTSCVYNGNCCPDVEPLTLPEDAKDVANIQDCVATSINFENYLNINLPDKSHVTKVKIGATMVTECAVAINETRCSTPNSTVLIENIPVTSIHNGVTYKNMFCANCNGVNNTEVSPWLTYVTCSELKLMKGSDLMFPNSADKVFDFVVKSNKDGCGFSFMPPPDISVDIPVCFENNAIISTCPTDYSNATVAQACSEIYLPFIKTTTNDTHIYANYFCYICNAVPVPNAENAEICPEVVDLKLHVTNDFVAELNAFGGNESNLLAPWQQSDLTPRGLIPAGVKCSDGMAYDPFLEKCRTWYCPSERMYVEGECVPIVTNVLKATYSISLVIKPDHESMDAFKTADKIALTQNVLEQMYGDRNHLRTEVIILSIMDDFSYMFMFLLVHVNEHSQNVSALFNQDTYGTDFTIVTVNDTLVVNVDFSIGVKVELSTFPLSDIIILDLKEYVALKNIYRVNISEIETSFRYTPITRLAFCSQIMLQRNEIRDYIDVFDIRKSDTRIHIGEFARTSRFDNVRVCISEYLRHVGRYLAEKNRATYYSPQAILSVVCNMLSIGGLVFTIVTYIIFDELRSVPGKNNMMLALHLLIAQCLYQFGMDQSDKPEMCIILGIFIHMFWLIAIFWMNACTLHMFRTFVTGQSYRSVRAFDPQVCCYAMYCYAVGTCMVAVNIAVSMYRSDGKDIGYGGRVCYISNPVMVGWVFALPVGVIIILNMGFFFAVVYQISASTMRRRGKSTDRANTIIYMKLSSLTGVTWIFGYLYLWTDFTPLEYIFIVLNAGQGVFIFISFICTQRITKMYRNLFRKCLFALEIDCRCLCLRRGFESETNGVEMNTAKVSLTADTTTKRRTTGAKKKPKVLKLSSDSHVGSKSDSVSETPQKPVAATNNDPTDMFKESARIAHALINPKPVGDPPLNRYDIDVGTLNNHVDNGNVTNGIATIGLDQIDFISTKNTDNEEK